jgi:hypothetical protein
MSQILYCRCAYAQVIPEEVKNRHLEELCASGQEFEAVPDLCEAAAVRDPRLRTFAERDDLVVLACHPRAVRGLFQQAGCALSATAEIVNMRQDELR